MTHFKLDLLSTEEDYYKAFQYEIDKLDNPNDGESIKQLLFNKLHRSIEYTIEYLLQDFEVFDKKFLVQPRTTIPMIKKINSHFEIVDSVELNKYVFNTIEERLNKYISIEQQNSIEYRTYLKGILKQDFIMSEQWYDSFDGIYNYDLLKYLIVKSRNILAHNVFTPFSKNTKCPLKLILDKNYAEFLKYL